MESSAKYCPLCIENLEANEQNFYPCPCGYQICLFCYQKIMETNQLCPACRHPFSPDSRNRIGPQYAPQNNIVTPTDFFVSKKILQVIGLPDYLLNKTKLIREEFFGQYGEIKQLRTFNNQPPFVYSAFPKRSSSVYVRFKHENDAINCYLALNGFSTPTYTLHVAFAITEQCSSFLLNGKKCGLSDCLKMHRKPKPSEIVLKDKDIEKQSKKFTNLMKIDIPDHYNQYPLRCSGRSVFPPPRMVQPNFNFQLFDINNNPDFQKPSSSNEYKTQLLPLCDILHI